MPSCLEQSSPTEHLCHLSYFLQPFPWVVSSEGQVYPLNARASRSGFFFPLALARTPVVPTSHCASPVHGTLGFWFLERRRRQGWERQDQGCEVGGCCRNPRRRGHIHPSLLNTLAKQCVPQPCTALGIDLTGVMGNGEMTDTHTENLGLGGTCTPTVMR